MAHTFLAYDFILSMSDLKYDLLQNNEIFNFKLIILIYRNSENITLLHFPSWDIN